LLQSDTLRQSLGFLSLPNCGFPAPVPPTSSIPTAYVMRTVCTQVCGQQAGNTKIKSCVADFGSTKQPKFENPKFRGGRIRVCPKAAAGPQTLTPRIAAATSPISFPLPPFCIVNTSFGQPFQRPTVHLSPKNPICYTAALREKPCFTGNGLYGKNTCAVSCNSLD
jgi:hypothetical protein